MPETRGKNDAIKVEVNILEGLPWTGEAREVDPNEDAWQRNAPPPAGIYEHQLSIHDATLIKYNEKDESTWSYELNVEGRITEKHAEFAGIPSFLRVSTYRRRGAKISTAEGALVKLGVDKTKLAAAKLTHKQVVDTLAKILAKGPIALWETDWRASYSYIDKKSGDTKYVNCLSTYDEFPDNPDGGKEHIVKVTTNTGGKEEVAAQSRVIKWIGKGEDATPSRKAAKATAQSVEDSLDLGETKVNGAAPVGKLSAAAGSTGGAKSKLVEDELDLS
jgi:hypothetical protein